MISNSDPLIFWLLQAGFVAVFSYSLYRDRVTGYRKRRGFLNARFGYDAMNRARFIAIQAVLAVLVLHIIDVAVGVRHKLLITLIDMAMLAYLTFRSGWWLDKLGSGKGVDR